MSKFRVHLVFFVKELQLLGAASKKLGGNNFLRLVNLEYRRFEKWGECLIHL